MTTNTVNNTSYYLTKGRKLPNFLYKFGIWNLINSFLILALAGTVIFQFIQIRNIKNEGQTVIVLDNQTDFTGLDMKIIELEPLKDEDLK